MYPCLAVIGLAPKRICKCIIIHAKRSYILSAWNYLNFLLHYLLIEVKNMIAYVIDGTMWVDMAYVCCVI